MWMGRWAIKGLEEEQESEVPIAINGGHQQWRLFEMAVAVGSPASDLGPLIYSVDVIS